MFSFKNGEWPVDNCKKLIIRQKTYFIKFEWSILFTTYYRKNNDILTVPFLYFSKHFFVSSKRILFRMYHKKN